MINAKPRFGLDVQAGVEVLFDYQTSRYINVGDLVEDAHGIWDTSKVAELIGSGQSIELAFTANSSAAPEIPGASDEVQQAATDFMTADLESGGEAPADEPPAVESAPESPAEAAAADAGAIEPDPAPEDVKAG